MVKNVKNDKSKEVVEAVKEDAQNAAQAAVNSAANEVISEDVLPEVPDVENKEAEKAEETKEEAKKDEAVEKPFVSGADMYAKHADAVKDAKQFYQCQLPSISYYSKRALCEAVDNMKRMCDRSKGLESLDMCIKMFEVAIAYLYNRKING